MIRGLGTVVVAQISCGDRHSVALTKAGQLFAWGDNSFGQLGVGKAAGDKAAAPKVFACFITWPSSSSLYLSRELPLRSSRGLVSNLSAASNFH